MIQMFCDNASVIRLSESDNYYRARSKHYGCKVQLFRDCVEDKSICLTYVKSAENPADIFTKALDRTKHIIGCRNLNLFSM